MTDVTCQIYALVDPRTLRIRYIGKTTKTLDERLRGHVYNAIKREGTTHRDRWIQSLHTAGLAPEVVLVDSGVWDTSTFNEREIYWIAFYRAQNTRLTNMTEGGDGRHSYQASEETKEKMRGFWANKMQDNDYAQRVAEGNKLRWQTNDEGRALISQQSRDRWADPDSALRRANQQRRSCNMCDAVMSPGNLGRHSIRTGHAGYTVVGDA